MEKIKNICRDLGRAFTIGLLSGGAAAAVLLLGGFLFGGFTFRAALEAAKDGLLLIAALGMFVLAYLMYFIDLGLSRLGRRMKRMHLKERD